MRILFIYVCMIYIRVYSFGYPLHGNARRGAQHQQCQGPPPLPFGDQDLLMPLFLFSTLVTGPRRSFDLELNVTGVYEPQMRARIRTTAHSLMVSGFLFPSGQLMLKPQMSKLETLFRAKTDWLGRWSGLKTRQAQEQDHGRRAQGRARISNFKTRIPNPKPESRIVNFETRIPNPEPRIPNMET